MAIHELPNPYLWPRPAGHVPAAPPGLPTNGGAVQSAERDGPAALRAGLVVDAAAAAANGNGTQQQARWKVDNGLADQQWMYLLLHEWMTAA